MLYNFCQALNAIVVQACCGSPKPKEIKESKQELLTIEEKRANRVNSINEGGEEQEKEWDYDMNSPEENLEHVKEMLVKCGGFLNWKNDEHTKDENFYKTVAVASDKTEVKFKEDILALILCIYTKKNAEGFVITGR
jgi:hypothetical protein